MTSSGNTPRLSESLSSHTADLHTFFSSDNNSLNSLTNSTETPHRHNAHTHHNETPTSPKPPPPPVAAKPKLYKTSEDILRPKLSKCPSVSKSKFPPSYDTAVKSRSNQTDEHVPDVNSADQQHNPGEVTHNRMTHQGEVTHNRMTHQPVVFPHGSQTSSSDQTLRHTRHGCLHFQPLPDRKETSKSSPRSQSSRIYSHQQQKRQRVGSNSGPPQVKSSISLSYDMAQGLFQRRRESHDSALINHDLVKSKLLNTYPPAQTRSLSDSDFTCNKFLSSNCSQPKQRVDKCNNYVTETGMEGSSLISDNNSTSVKQSTPCSFSNINNCGLSRVTPAHSNPCYQSGNLKRHPLGEVHPFQPTIGLNTSKNQNTNIFTTDNDTPPPLPPKGEFLKRRSSVESQKSSDSKCPQDGDHVYRPRSGSRNSVEIQDITENQYIIYNPDLPVKQIFDHNQNLPGLENRNPRISPFSNKKLVKVPPLDLPDDMLGVSGSESDDVFGDSERTFQSQTRLRESPKGILVKNNSLDLKKKEIERGISNREEPQKHQHSFCKEQYPDDTYIDVQRHNTEVAKTNSSVLKVLPLDNSSQQGSKYNFAPHV